MNEAVLDKPLDGILDDRNFSNLIIQETFFQITKKKAVMFSKNTPEI